MNFDPQRNVARCPHTTHRSGNSESRRVGLMSSPAYRDWGSVFAVRHGSARYGEAGHGRARGATRKTHTSSSRYNSQSA